MKNIVKFLYKNYINKNSKILNIMPNNFDMFDLMIKNGHNRFNLVSITDNEVYYKKSKDKKFFCLYGDVYDKVNYNIEDNEYDLVCMFDRLVDTKMITDELYWKLKNNRFIISIFDNIRNIEPVHFIIDRKYKDYVLLQRKYI